MTFYQELQLNQAGSKAVIRACQDRKDKLKHIAIYIFKIVITMVFCMAFVIGYSVIFGDENSIAGVAVLLCILTFRFADLGINARHSVCLFPVIFAIMTVGPRLANAGGLLLEFLIHIVCILSLMVLGCHNVVMFNHSTLLLGYLLLYGYDATGMAYLYRLAAMALGCILTMIVFYRNHKNRSYKRTMRNLFMELDLHSFRTMWQVKMTFGIATAILLAGILHVPRRMWIGIAVMSILLPFRKELKARVKDRIPGNVAGGVLFLVIYFLLPEQFYTYIGIIGGIGVGLSESYRWQAVFNSLGAISIATAILGLPGAVFFRIFNNAFGALYGLVFEYIFHEKFLPQ